MLGRFVYVLIVAGALLAGGFVFDFIANEPGQLTIDYADRVYEFTLFEAALVLVLAILALMAVLWTTRLIVALIRFILYGEGLERGRERRGLDALAKGLIAVAAGDVKTARRKAEIAERKLRKPELTRLLNAQAAEIAGEPARAATYYKALMSDPATAFIGTKGLLGQALEAGQTDRALKLANHARELSPKDADTLETLYMLQSQKFDWAAARKTLTAQRKAGHVPQLEAARREAALLLAQSEDADRLGETEHARALAIDAAKKDPTNVDAACAAAQHLIGSGSKRAASKIVLDAWRARPHARLAAAYAAIEPDEAPAQRRRRFEALFALHPDHEETRFLTAELALVAEDWSGARKAIEALRETELSARSCAIMAAIARGEGEPDHIIRGWLARAIGAPRAEEMETEISHAAMLPLLIEPRAEEVAEPEPEVEPETEPKPAPDLDAVARHGEGVPEEAPEQSAEEATAEEEEAGPKPKAEAVA